MPHTLDVDLGEGRFYAEGLSHEAYRWMRVHQPVFRDRNGLAAAATYRSVIDAERNPQLFSNAGGIRPTYPPMPYMIDMDDPGHLLRRKLVSAAFTGRRVRDKALSIRKMCDELIDAVCEQGSCDFVRDIAAPLPMAVSVTCWVRCPRIAQHCCAGPNRSSAARGQMTTRRCGL